MSDVSICVCQNDDCSKPYVVEESIDFLKSIDITPELRDWASNRVLKYCVDCCMEMMTSIHDVYFKKELDIQVSEVITALSREEWITHLKDRNNK